MLGLLLGYHNSTINLLYTHDIPGPIVFPFCCWAGLKSVSLPKMKPHSGLFTSVGEYLLLQLWTVAVSFLFGESGLVSTTTYNVWSLWTPSVTRWISIVPHMVPSSEMAVSYRVFAFGCGWDECVYLRPVWLDTWSGNREEQQAPSGSYSCLLSGKHRDIVYLWDDLASAGHQNVSYVVQLL